ncbi:methyl-accepting chemotaxis protein [Rubrivivax sp. RP6-9]|uniref:methyl-accepting chemotaxis protein n=1 Tax=Rubrivivax sp. RP6-9 TaxID=3415750 RepID=UPI003CC5C578
MRDDVARGAQARASDVDIEMSLRVVGHWDPVFGHHCSKPPTASRRVDMHNTIQPPPPSGQPTQPARSIGLRTLLTAFAAAAVLVSACLSGVSLWGAFQARDAASKTFTAKDVTADILPPPMYLIEMRLVLSQAVEGTLAPDGVQAEVRRLKAEYEARVQHWTAHPPHGLEAKLLGPQHTEGRAFIAHAVKIADAAAAGADPATLRADLQAAHAAYQAHRAGVDATVRESLKFADASLAAFDTTVQTTKHLQWAMLALAAACLSGLGMYIRRAVWSAVGGEPADVAAIARAVARGNLSVQVPVAAGDSTSIMATMAQMRQSLAGIVMQVRSSSDSIATGASDIARGNNDLSARTEQQASALEETSASAEQLQATVRQTSDNAHQASRLARDATDVAVQGGEVVARVVETMKSINDSSKKIADIIGVIDGIAFQTNILALNAAVEAARAGEQGRGFAVVASEVRSLAGRSAKAAREIKSLISASVAGVEQGTVLADQAGATMTEVVGAIQRATRIMGDISNVSTEQSAGVAQVGQAIGQMDQVTQQNAALVEQSAVASESLRAQAQQLVQTMAIFKLA